LRRSPISARFQSWVKARILLRNCWLLHRPTGQTRSRRQTLPGGSAEMLARPARAQPGRGPAGQPGQGRKRRQFPRRKPRRRRGLMQLMPRPLPAWASRTASSRPRMCAAAPYISTAADPTTTTWRWPWRHTTQARRRWTATTHSSYHETQAYVARVIHEFNRRCWPARPRRAGPGPRPANPAASASSAGTNPLKNLCRSQKIF